MISKFRSKFNVVYNISTYHVDNVRQKLYKMGLIG